MKKNNASNIEVEFRSRFSKNKYLSLKRFLDLKAKNLGKDDKDVYFFIMPDKLLKVVNNISKKTAKIVLKLNKIGKGSDFEELEILIDPKTLENWVTLFTHLGFHNMMHTYQKRQNYEYKGIEIALKWSEVWGYHLELEILIKDKKQKASVETKIKKVAQELGLQLMTDKELSRFTAKKEKEYKKRK